MHYRVHSTIIAPLRWYPTKAEAIAASTEPQRGSSIVEGYSL